MVPVWLCLRLKFGRSTSGQREFADRERRRLRLRCSLLWIDVVLADAQIDPNDSGGRERQPHFGSCRQWTSPGVPIRDRVGINFNCSFNSGSSVAPGRRIVDG